VRDSNGFTLVTEPPLPQELRVQWVPLENFEPRIRRARGLRTLLLPISANMPARDLEEWATRLVRNERTRWTYSESQKYARQKKVTTAQQWSNLSLPERMPRSPQKTYAGAGWTNWGEFLGTGRSARTSRGQFVTYAEAQAWAETQKIKTKRQWLERMKDRPVGIPVLPEDFYADKGWISWGEFLKTKRVATSQRKFRPYSQAEKWARRQNLSSVKEYVALGPARPADIPSNPHVIYANSGWVDWQKYLGTGFVSYKKAQAYLKRYGIRSAQQYNSLNEDRPSWLPSQPEKFYRRSGDWTSWGDFLGTGNTATRTRKREKKP
jgi:hypothetical protein